MIYILDTSFFVDAHNLHFPVNVDHDFWNWILALAHKEMVSIPRKIYEEVTNFTDELSEWVKANRSSLVDKNEIAYQKVIYVMEKGYGSMDEYLLEGLGADPYIIAHALAVNGAVVTSEKFAAKTNPSKKKVPQVCQTLNIPCYTATRFIWEIRDYLPEKL